MKRRRKGSGTIEKTDETPPRFRARFPFRKGDRDEIGIYDTYKLAELALDGVLLELREKAQSTGNSLKRIGEKLLNLREKEGYRASQTDRDRWAAYIEPWECCLEPIDTISPGDVRHFLANLTGKRVKDLSTSTRRNVRNLLSAVCQYAVDEGWLESNPVALVRVKARASTQETSTWLTKQEAIRLITASVSPEVTIAIFTGLRSSELQALRWDDVSDTHIVVRYGKPGKQTKGGRIRRVPLLIAARAALDAMRERRVDVQGQPSYVLPSPTGHHRPKGQLVELADWRAWLKSAGIDRRVRWHDLRHTCATLCLNGGMTGTPWSYEAVKDLLGHSSVKVTERYARSLGLADAAANVHTAPIRKPGDKPGDDRPLVVQVVDLIQRRGWDSNPRMTVLQTFGAPSSGEDMGEVPGLVRAYSDLAGHLDRERSIWDAYDAFELAEMKSEELH